MGLIELLFEKKNPGSVGTIQSNKGTPGPVKYSILIIKLFITGILIRLIYFITVRDIISLNNIIIFVIVFSLYCIIGYSVIPKPDHSNIGWMGGLFDNPFRYSDDINRMLIVFQILLYPGRFISTTILQTVIALQNLFIKRKNK